MTIQLTEAERLGTYKGVIKNPPKMIEEIPPYKIEDLFNAMFRLYELGEDEVRSILKRAGLTNFNPESWLMYFDLVRQHLRTQSLMESWPRVCPICKAEVMRNSKMDFKYGARLGWTCKENGSHFFEERVKEWRKNFETISARTGDVYAGRT